MKVCSRLEVCQRIFQEGSEIIVFDSNEQLGFLMPVEMFVTLECESVSSAEWHLS